MTDQTEKMRQVSVKAILREKELWVLVLLGILYFYRPLFLGETFFFRDLYAYFLPQKQLLLEFIKAGKLPLWNPYLNGGQAYLANIANSVLYPFNLLYFCLPLLRAFNLNIVLHLIFCSVFAYIFSRAIGFQPVSSVIVGVVYGFCGYTLSLINVLNLLLAMPYLPLLFLGWHLFLLEKKRKWFVITVIIGVLQLLVGAPEINIMSLLSLLGWTLFYPYLQCSLSRRLVLWFLLGLFTIGITSIQLFPTAEIMLQSPRGHGLSYPTFSYWSLYPGRLPEFIFPGFFGYVDTLQDLDYWGLHLLDGQFPYILSIYFGCVALVLAIVGGVTRSNKTGFPFRVRISLLLLFLCSLLLSLGRFLPFFPVLYQYIPLIRLFRYPSKFLAIGILPLAMLAGYTADVHFEKPQSKKQGERENMSLLDQTSLQHISYRNTWTPSSKTLVVLWSVLIVFLTFTITFLLSNNFANQFQELIFKQPGGEEVHRGLGLSFVHASIAWLLVTLLYQYRRLNKRPWQRWIIASIIVVDLLSAGKRLNPSAPEEFLTSIPSVVQIIRNEIGNGRLFRVKNPSNIILQAPSNEVIWRYRWNLEVLNFDLAAFYQIPVIFHGDLVKLASVHLMELQTLINSLPWSQRLPLLAAGRVTVIITDKKLAVPGIHYIAEIPNRSNLRFYLYRNETTVAQVEFITSWEFANSDTEARKAMLKPNYDPRKHVILQASDSTHFQFHDIPREPVIAQIHKLKSNTHSALFSVFNNQHGYLVFSEPFYPGWQVYVDGKLVPILRANYAFSAIFLSAGEHEVKRCYRPNSLLAGVLSSVVFSCVLLLIAYKGWIIRIY